MGTTSPALPPRLLLLLVPQVGRPCLEVVTREPAFCQESGRRSPIRNCFDTWCVPAAPDRQDPDDNDDDDDPGKGEARREDAGGDPKGTSTRSHLLRFPGADLSGVAWSCWVIG